MCSSSSSDTETLAASESCFESLMSQSLMKEFFLARLRRSPLHMNFWLILLQVLDWELMVVPEYFRAFLSAKLESSLCLHRASFMDKFSKELKLYGFFFFRGNRPWNIVLQLPANVVKSFLFNLWGYDNLMM